MLELARKPVDAPYTQYPYIPFDVDVPEDPEIRRELARDQLLAEAQTAINVAKTPKAKAYAEKYRAALSTIKDWNYVFNIISDNGTQIVDRHEFVIDGFEPIPVAVERTGASGKIYTTLVEKLQPIKLINQRRRNAQVVEKEGLSVTGFLASDIHRKFAFEIEAAYQVTRRTLQLVPGTTVRESLQRAAASAPTRR